MQKQKLTDIPEHIMAHPALVRTGAKWQTDYNVAAWFRFKQISQDTVRLHLHWIDEAGEHFVCIDQATIGSASVLLSGIARLKVTGRIETMSIAVEGNNFNFTVDELFVQPARRNIETKQA
jgi:hypothetical protein